MFRKPLAKALNRRIGRRAGVHLTVLQALSGLSEEQAEFQIMDRRTLGRFLGFWMAWARPRIGIGRQKPRLPIEGGTACGSYAKQN